MKNQKIHVHVFLTLIFLMGISFQSFRNHSKIGEFTRTSTSTLMRTVAAEETVKQAVLPGIAGFVGAYVGLLAVAYESGYVVGRIATALYTYASTDQVAELRTVYGQQNYKALAFEKFDN